MTTRHLPSRLDHYRLLGRSGLRVSPLCLGTMTFGTEWGWGCDRKTSQAIFEKYAAAGGNFLDTANRYTEGTSEKFLADFMGSERDRYVLATKYSININPGDPNAGGNHKKSMKLSLERSLKFLKTDYIDLFWLHVWDFTTPVDELMRGLDDLVKSGKVLYLAISDTPAWKVAELNTWAEAHALSRFVATQVEYSLIKRDAERDLLPMSRELGLGLLPWSPLAGGILSGKYSQADIPRLESLRQQKELRSSSRAVRLTERHLQIVEAVKAIAKETEHSPAQVALNWLLSRPGVTAPIIGARTLSQLEDNLGCLDFRLSDTQIQNLEAVSAIELGFPHDFLAGEMVRNLVSGETLLDREKQ